MHASLPRATGGKPSCKCCRTSLQRGEESDRSGKGEVEKFDLTFCRFQVSKKTHSVLTEEQMQSFPP